MTLPLDKSWADAIWRSPFRLRFELSTGECYVNKFTSAYDRARQLAPAALPLDQPLAVVAALASPFWAINSDRPEAADATDFGVLQAMGVSTDKAEAVWEGYYYLDDENDEDCSPCEHRAIRVTWDEADILLWNNQPPRAP